jgi:hypothetical protein
VAIQHHEFDVTGSKKFKGGKIKLNPIENQLGEGCAIKTN